MELSQILGYTATFLFSIMCIPQIMTTLKTNSVKDVSLSMFIIGFIANVIALFYAYLIGQTPLIIKYVVALIGIGIYLFVYFKVKYKNDSSI